MDSDKIGSINSLELYGRYLKGKQLFLILKHCGTSAANLLTNTATG